jgi:hypothetical protein
MLSMTGMDQNAAAPVAPPTITARRLMPVFSTGVVVSLSIVLPVLSSLSYACARAERRRRLTRTSVPPVPIATAPMMTIISISAPVKAIAGAVVGVAAGAVVVGVTVAGAVAGP